MSGTQRLLGRSKSRLRNSDGSMNTPTNKSKSSPGMKRNGSNQSHQTGSTCADASSTGSQRRRSSPSPTLVPGAAQETPSPRSKTTIDNLLTIDAQRLHSRSQLSFRSLRSSSRTRASSTERRRSDMPSSPMRAKLRRGHRREGSGGRQEAGRYQGQVHSGDTLESYILPASLRMVPSDMNLAGSGMEVIKLSKNGKQQTRRIAIAPNHRSIFITTHRTHGVLGLLTKKMTDGSMANANVNGSHGVGATKEVDLSLIVRIQLGQQSRKFVRARSKMPRQSSYAVSPDRSTTKLHSSDDAANMVPSPTNNNNNNNNNAHPTSHSLSIIYRPPTSATGNVGTTVKENLVHMATHHYQSNAVANPPLDDGIETLDLMIPSKTDYDALTRTLNDLLRLYEEEEPRINPDLAWMQYHLVDMGKSLGKQASVMGGTSAVGDCYVTASDWSLLCKRWNVPVPRSEVMAMYRSLRDSLGLSNPSSPTSHGSSEAGLELHEVLRLMELLRQRAMEKATEGDTRVSSFKGGRDSWTESSLSSFSTAVVEDPRKRLFRRATRSRSSTRRKGEGIPPTPSSTDDCEIISASAFLNFLHEKQKETDMDLDDVKGLFEQLNGHKVSKQLGDALSVVTGMTGNMSIGAGEGFAWEREYITWDTFARYLLMDMNDVFDPERSSRHSSHMSEPLNHYWINTSHDTYLRRTKTATSDQKQLDWTDLQSYTLALYRGARAIELDVWDGPMGSKDPRVRSGVTSFDNSGHSNSPRSDSSLIFAEVILTIAFFLESEPKCYPVILLIENHCSLAYQEKMAADIEDILGSRGLLYRPDSSHSKTLPSPAQLRGKVAIKSKRPQVIQDGATVVNNDFDDENGIASSSMLAQYDSDDEIKGHIYGLNLSGSHQSPDQLFYNAKKEASEANSAMLYARNRLLDAKQAAVQSQNRADALLRDIGMTYDELRKKKEYELVENFPLDRIGEEGTEVELFQDGPRVKEGASHGMQLAKFFEESVEESRLLSDAANAEARSEAELFEMAREDLTDKETILAEAKEALQEAAKRKLDLSEAADRALSDARSNREYADNAENRVKAVRALLDKSHDRAVSSETVAGTADAEAKISEQRARDAEARAEKARAHADHEQQRAEKETKLEDDIEAQLTAAHEKMSEAMTAIEAARSRADDAVSMSEKLNDEIRGSKSSPTHYQSSGTPSIYDEEHSMTSSFANRTEERKLYIDQLEDALQDKLSIEAKTRRLENIIHDLKRKAKMQAKVAAVARRQADHSMALADQLEEHALEEREAANLRQAAREKAKLGVQCSDAVLTSTEAQLVEAERAASEANDLALSCRFKAEQLAKEAEAAHDITEFEETAKIALEQRNIAYATYESAKESKEDADQRAAKAKQVHETNCLNLSNSERDAMADLLHRESVRQAEVLAIGACENAKARFDHVNVLEKKYNEAETTASDKAAALEIAKRFKEKKLRVQPISTSLAKVTLLHSSKIKNWNKSMTLPSWHMHNISDQMVAQLSEKRKDEWRQWVEFNSNHCSRVFPSSSSRNFNPTLSWAMGCQFVSMNFISRNEYLLLNDGRFRENGNQGYVLKPKYLRNIESGPSVINDALHCNPPVKISIRILSGYCLPKSELSMEKRASNTSAQKISINPFVRVMFFDGSPSSHNSLPSYTTQVIQGNGLNPVWNEKDSAYFSCLNPSVGMILFSVYDRCDVTSTDLLIGASAVPVSCLREGYRSVSLFDSNNTRSGAMKFSSLLIKVKTEP